MHHSSKYALYRFREERIDETISKGFKEFGIDEKIKECSLIMIKPNLVSDVKEYIENGCNTDIRIIEAVLKFLGNYNVKVVIAESETGTKIKGRRLQRALDYMGVAKLRKRYDFEIVNLTNDEQIPVRWENGLMLKKLNMGKTSLDADLIINIPKLKTHKYATITCALKNMFGCIPDPLRIVYHKNIHKAIADINTIFIDKTFVILDGIKCMEGQGPLFGNSVDMRIIGFCDDALVNDYVCAEIMGFEPFQIKHIDYFRKRYHNIDLDNIKITGELKIADVRRKFEPSHKNWFVKVEEQLMRNHLIVRILFSDFVRRHITYHFRDILKKLRGGSYSWYIDRDDDSGNSI